MSARERLWRIALAALAAVDPLNCVFPHLPARPIGRLIVVGAGKAAARMALAAERHYGPLEGVILTRHGHGVPLSHLRMIEAGHPLPDEAGLCGASEILNLANSLTSGDHLLVLLSGGGSALMTLPAEGVHLKVKQTVTSHLLKSGASIAEINCVRKHLSRIKGGRLAAAAYPARVTTLAISDVPGDDPCVIASGPTVGDPTTLAEARDVLRRYRIEPHSEIERALTATDNETPKPGHPRLLSSVFTCVARPSDALWAAAAAARGLGYAVLDLGDRIEGPAGDTARLQAAIALAAVEQNERLVILSGGELTVAGAGNDRSGGRSREFALALALALQGRQGICALAMDTDGIDGTDDAAGAFVFADTLERCAAHGLSASRLLAEHASGEVFAAIGDAIVTGPTGTNVADLRVILVDTASSMEIRED